MNDKYLYRETVSLCDSVAIQTWYSILTVLMFK